MLSFIISFFTLLAPQIPVAVHAAAEVCSTNDCIVTEPSKITDQEQSQ